LRVERARLRFFLRAVIGAALLGWLAHRTGFGPGVLEAPVRTLGAVGLTSLLLAIGQALSAWRWQLFLGPDAPRWLDLFRVYLIGQFAGLFLPTSVGGDVVRIVAVSRVRPAGLTVLSILLDRGLGLGALLVYLGIGVLLVPAHTAGWGTRLQVGVSPSWWIAGAALVALLLLFLAPHPMLGRVRAFASETLRAMAETFRRRPRAFGAALLLSFFVQGIYILAWRTAGTGAELVLPLNFLLFAVPVVSLATMVPVTIHGASGRASGLCSSRAGHSQRERRSARAPVLRGVLAGGSGGRDLAGASGGRTRRRRNPPISLTRGG
jgi:hypothetical protein